MIFYNFMRNEAGGDELHIDGEITSEDGGWWGASGQIVARRFRQQLARCGDVTVFINSPGGDVFAGAEIYTALREHKGKVTVKISGIAASAASVIAMAGDEVLMSPVAYMMIHDPWTYAMGNAREMEHQAQVLREIGEGLIAAYTTKTGKSRDEIADLLAAETYMNAEQAVREGFADGILYEEAQAPAQQPQQAMMMQARRYGPAAICAMVRAADAAHAKPATQNPDAKRRAEIAQRAQIIADYYINIKEREEQTMPNTTMNSLRNSITEMGARIREAASALAVAANDESISMEEVQRQQAALRAMNERMNALQASYNAQFGENAGTLPTPPAMSASDERSLRDMLGSNEYARAFARAIRTGMRPGRGPSGEQDKILFDALTIAGGTTAGEDGGFLVPEDIDHNIRELRRELSPLADLFNNESVSSNSGWRVVDTAPTTGMTALASEVPTGGISKDDQPKFAKVTYSLKTYGLIVPVSNELANDEVANLFGYLSRWFAKKQILTENLLLKAELEALTAGAITSADDPIASLKATLNKELDPAISAMAVILTNQDGFDYLDQKKDTTGRGLLQPDPTNPTSMLFKGRPVKMVANSLLPNRVVTTTGATKGDYLPLYVGDFKEFATLFTRQPLEVTSTDIGGNAFHTNSIEVRGITRLDASTFDSKAAVRKEIFIAAS